MSQAFEFHIPIHGGILPERLWVRPGVALLGQVIPLEQWDGFSKG
jgi:hypothetical protein